MTSGAPSIAVVVPVIDEEERLPAALASARGPGVELVVADGGSSDHSAGLAAAAGARVVVARPGRARQMNAAARATRAPALVFLHGDTRLPEGWATLVRETLARPGVAAGAFRLRLDGPGAALRLIERGANLRARWLGLPYGDQALFVGAATFERVGGWPEIDILEDVAFVRALRRVGRVVIVDATVRTSPRRFERLGPFRTTLLNQAILVGYGLGMSPPRLAAWYRSGHLRPPRRGDEPDRADNRAGPRPDHDPGR